MTNEVHDGQRCDTVCRDTGCATDSLLPSIVALFFVPAIVVLLPKAFRIVISGRVDFGDDGRCDALVFVTESAWNIMRVRESVNRVLLERRGAEVNRPCSDA